MFCPKCKAEYRDGFYKCASCKIDLVLELPLEPEEYTECEYLDLINIKTYPTRFEAELVKGLLSTNGIDAFNELPRSKLRGIGKQIQIYEASFGELNP